MTETRSERIFISYSTEDGGAFADDLRRDLEAQGFSIWQDIVALKGSADWWSQIEDALRAKALQHFVLVVTPGALASEHVRDEIRLARQEGKTVLPVRGPGIADLAALPRWLGNVYDLNEPERKTNLLRMLERPSDARRVPMMAPEPPEDFVPRPHEFEPLKLQLLDKQGDAVAITAALTGAGGYGKTTLARALAHDPDVQDAYFDGVLWVELGEQGGDRVRPLLADLVAKMTGARCTVDTLEGLRSALAEALGDRRILLVVDDVWQRSHLDPFLQGGRYTTRLVTTRFDGVLPADTERHAVDAMRSAEALTLIGQGLPAAEVADQAAEVADQSEALDKLAGRLGEWAQLLKLANGFLQKRSGLGRSVESAVTDLNRRFDKRGLTALDAAGDLTYDQRHQSVAMVIDTSLELLGADQRARFCEIGVFPEDVDIPIGIVARLWAETGGLDEDETEDLLVDLSGLSLLLSLDLARRTLRLHDTTRHYLQDHAGKDGLAAQHQALVRAVGDLRHEPSKTPEAEYVFRHLPEHLADAGDRPALNALLLDPGWLKAKLAVMGSPPALVADYDRHALGEAQELVGRTLRLTSGICARDPRQLVPQLLGRLMARPSADGFLAAARLLIDRPAILTERPSLTPPGAESARLEGHANWVTALAVLPDGRLASGSHDKTIRLWDPETGQEHSRLEGHADPVAALAVLPDGRLASGSYDKTIRLWDPKTGQEHSRLEGHTGPVAALAVLPDGRLASGAYDKTIRLWDPKTGQEHSRLEGHTGPVAALAVLPDGRLASGSYDNTIRLWDPKTGQEHSRLEGHTDLVTALAVLPDGRLASGAYDNTIRLWDPKTGQEHSRLEGHTNWVTALAVLPDGRLASGAYDNTIRLWDPKTGQEHSRLEGHTNWVTALAVLPDGRLASGAYDNTIRLWDPKTGQEHSRLEGHTNWVTALVVLPDGRLASGAYDNTIRLWDPKTGQEHSRLEGHTNWVTALVVLPDGRLASRAYDKTIRLWDPKTGQEHSRLEGHTGPVAALAVLPDGRLASGSDDKTVRLWDPKTGQEHSQLELDGAVHSVSVLLAKEDKHLRLLAGDALGRLHWLVVVD